MPHRTPIRLANNCIVYSAGVGNVRFEPVIDGKPSRQLVFQNVLHVPDLRSHLFSVLYLTRNKGFHVSIFKNCMQFRQKGTLLFTATVNERNAAFLDGRVIPSTETELAQAASTLQMDHALWHRRFGHLNHASVQDVIRLGLVTGLDIQNSGTAPDPICEPCLAGKLHRGPIPSVASHRATRLLELVHSDLHGPLPVTSRHGYRYWIMFIDDTSRFWYVVLLKNKSEAFAAFRQFKAYAENHTNARIRSFRDDKGGEYMSTEFNQFLVDSGIQRQHTI